MAQKRKLDLKELELQLPSIDSNETKIILGGNDYGGDSVGNFDMWYWGGNNNGADAAHDNYQDQGDLDHYYDVDGDGVEDNAGDGDDGNTDPGNNQNVYDGINVEDYDNLIIDTGNPLFDQAIENLLESNSELASLLEELLADGSNEIKFSIGDLGEMSPDGKYTLAETRPDDTYSNYEIIFNSHSFDADGNFIFDGNGQSTDGFNLADLTSEEEFAVNVAHELLHVQYSEMIKDSYDQMIANQGDLNDVANDLLNQYGEDFRDAYMFFDGNDWQWRDLNDEAQQEINGQYIHEYMQEHDQDFLQSVLDEFRNDFP